MTLPGSLRRKMKTNFRGKTYIDQFNVKESAYIYQICNFVPSYLFRGERDGLRVFMKFPVLLLSTGRLQILDSFAFHIFQAIPLFPIFLESPDENLWHKIPLFILLEEMLLHSLLGEVAVFQIVGLFKTGDRETAHQSLKVDK